MARCRRIALWRPWCSGNTAASKPAFVGSIPTGRACPTDVGSEPSISVASIHGQSLSRTPTGCGEAWSIPSDLGSEDSQVRILPPGPLCYHGVVTGIVPGNLPFYYCDRCRKFMLTWHRPDLFRWDSILLLWLVFQIQLGLIIVVHF